MSERSVRTINPEALLESFVYNLSMRAVGLLLRACVIMVGLVTTVALIAFGLIGFGLWLLKPGIIALILAGGIKFLFFPQ